MNLVEVIGNRSDLSELLLLGSVILRGEVEVREGEGGARAILLLQGN